MNNTRILSGIIILLLVGGAVFFIPRVHAPLTVTPPVEQPIVPEPIPVAPVEPITYSAVVLITDTPAKELVGIVGKENLNAVLALNRIDERHLKKNVPITIPSRFDDPFTLSAFPRSVPALAQTPKILLVSQRVQEFAVYEYGQLIRFGAVSTGKKATPSPSKLYHTNWKGKLVTSTVDDSWIMPWYFNLDNMEGVSMHQYDLPGYPASHACVRLLEADAVWLYEWADQWQLSPDGHTVLKDGTPVLLFGEYEYGKTAPWKLLPEDPQAIQIDPDTEVLPHIVL